MLIDEADTQLKNNNELRGVLDSGHERSGAYVLRCVGDDNDVTRFKTWAPKVIALIGRLPPTLEDRAILIEMKRKFVTQKVKRLPPNSKTFTNLLRECVRWAEDNVDELRKARPQVPEELHDRARDNWIPLLAIAEACGSRWARHARDAAVRLSGLDDDQTYSIQLLGDLRSLFKRAGDNKVTSSWIATQLGTMENRPWPEFSHGKPITPTGVAKLLKPFKIIPRQVRIGGDSKARGYTRDQFKTVFERYLPPIPPSKVRTMRTQQRNQRLSD